MDIFEASIVHHIALVLLLLWILSSLGWAKPIVFFAALFYLYKVYERYLLRLRKRLEFEGRKFADQQRLLSDSESVRWLNHVVEKIWPICMEQIASQQFLLPIIPWFLDKYKPWTVGKAVVQHLYLGRTPPVFTRMRVLHESTDDDHLVLELGMNFLSADDMSAILAVQLRKRLGFGMWVKMHVSRMHVEGKVLVGMKFLQQWPFLGRVRVCFVEPPYFQMTVKPIFNHGIDVTELPGIAGWLDKILADAFEQTLVEPNMLVVDVEKFASVPREIWFSVEEKHPIAFAKVEIIEATEVKPSDSNGLADPYVKGQLGPYRFRTEIQKKTLAPKWLEEFKIPISSWATPNILVLEILDKDRVFDDMLGDCSIDIADLRGGQRHDKWLTLWNINTGRLHLAITVLDIDSKKGKEQSSDESLSTETDTPKSNSMARNSGTFSKDDFEPINIEGQRETGIWIHHLGSCEASTQEPRKAYTQVSETQLPGEDDAGRDSPRSLASECSDNNNVRKSYRNDMHGFRTIRRGLHKFGNKFQRSSKNEIPRQNRREPVPTPHPRPKAVGEKGMAVQLMAEDSCIENSINLKANQKSCNLEKGEGGKSNNGHERGMGKP
ncbi:C2 domain-containing protein At1g53590 isoform X1 [Elaeis guineensis]|uniref:C2 domain-containing protein At1g53590 isoform X2 n=1 Tax=Elaeis guineensis var. tenera TaxID=51953 RepID=A0A6I9R1R8_ELAGV|nr:C2 domain-containing protein At1g53590 isoform X2 [Elaeis guineensis]